MVLWRKMFYSNLKVERKQCWNKHSVSGFRFYVHMRHYHFNFYWFFLFLDIFFIDVFSNHSKFILGLSFFFEPKFPFLVSVFFVHMRHSKFSSIFFGNDFPISLIVRSRSSLLFSQYKFFELYVRFCPAMFFCFTFRSCFSFYISHDFHA